MKVFLTGGTGFVGAHTALALLGAGHRVRLAVRNEDAARRWFGDRGWHVEIVKTNLCDVDAVRRAMADCDAVLHAAAAVSLDPTRAQATYDNNVGALTAVLAAAADRSISRIVCVSSLSVLFHPGASRIDEDTPLAPVREAYSRSKRDGDEHARRLQAQGVPVQLSYPAAVVGPDDPKLSEANGALRSFVSGVLPLTSAGFQCVDVRDLAQFHRWMLERPPPEPCDGRYVIGGHYYPWRDLHERLQRLLGRRIPALPMPGALLRTVGRLTDLLQAVLPFRTPVSAEAMAFVTQWPPAESRRICAASGLSFRSGEETFADTLRWMVRAGHLAPRHAGRLGSTEPAIPPA